MSRYNRIMKIIRTLAVTNTEFYDWLEKQLLIEIQAATGEILTATSIKKGRPPKRPLRLKLRLTIISVGLSTK